MAESEQREPAVQTVPYVLVLAALFAIVVVLIIVLR